MSLVDLEPTEIEGIQFDACLCLATQTSEVLRVLLKDAFDDRIDLGEATLENNCLAIASWIGDLSLVDSLHRGIDPLSFFGRPSWAAAAHGHLDVLQYLLGQGALPYEPLFRSRGYLGLGQSAIAAAASMGHGDVVRLYLQPPYLGPQVEDELYGAIHSASETDQPETLRILLDHHKQTQTEHEYLSTIDCSLRLSCTRGAPKATRVLLEYGADPNDTDKQPRSCLQHAAKAGNTATVKLLLDAGAYLDASRYVNKRTIPKLYSYCRKLGPEPLALAKKRNYLGVVQVLEERQREIDEERASFNASAVAT